VVGVGRRHPGRPGARARAAAAHALAALQLGTRRAVTATAHCDVVLTPTLAQPPAPVGWFRDAGDPRAEFDRMVAWTPFTAVYNTTGQPAASLPLHWNDEGLPIGVMLVGRPADELTVLRLSAQLEQARPWRDRHPELW
jgi:amidase